MMSRLWEKKIKGGWTIGGPYPCFPQSQGWTHLLGSREGQGLTCAPLQVQNALRRMTEKKAAKVLRAEQVHLAKGEGPWGQMGRAKHNTSPFRHSLALLTYRLHVPGPWPRRTPESGILREDLLLSEVQSLSSCLVFSAALISPSVNQS